MEKATDRLFRQRQRCRFVSRCAATNFRCHARGAVGHIAIERSTTARNFQCRSACFRKGGGNPQEETSKINGYSQRQDTAACKNRVAWKGSEAGWLVPSNRQCIRRL